LPECPSENVGDGVLDLEVPELCPYRPGRSRHNPCCVARELSPRSPSHSDSVPEPEWKHRALFGSHRCSDMRGRSSLVLGLLLCGPSILCRAARLDCRRLGPSCAPPELRRYLQDDLVSMPLASDHPFPAI